MVQRMLDGAGGSTVTWTRRTLSANGPAGTVTVTDTDDFDVRVAQVSEQTNSQASEGWHTAQVRLVVAAEGLPFADEAHSGEPEVHFDDSIEWLGVQMRVVSFDAWAVPGGPGAPPEPGLYFVGLAS